MSNVSGATATRSGGDGASVVDGNLKHGAAISWHLEGGLVVWANVARRPSVSRSLG